MNVATIQMWIAFIFQKFSTRVWSVQHASFHFTSLCLSSTKWLSTVQLTSECPARLFRRQMWVIWCKVIDDMEIKTVLLWCYSHVISCCECFIPTCNHKWEVEHFVCLISTIRDEEKDLYKSIVWPFHSQDVRCHDGRVIPYQCLNLYFHLRQFYFVNHIISFIAEIKEVLVHSPILPSPNAFFSFQEEVEIV